MATATETLSADDIPDFSCVKDFVSEADAVVFTEDEPAPLSPRELDNLRPEFRELEERLLELREAPLSELQKEKDATEGAGEAGGEDADDEPVKAVYFVRLPKVDYDMPGYDLLQQEFKAQLAQVKIYAERRRVQTLKKNEAKKDRNRVLECLKNSNALVNEQRRKLDPYRQERNEDRKARGALKDSRKKLAVSTEKELDELIRRLEFRMEHETITLAEEKDLHVQIKKLKASRPDVKRLEQQQAELTASEASTRLSPSNKEHLEKELKEYRAEQSMYEKMYHDLRDNEKKIEAELDQISAQLVTASKKKDAIYDKLSDARRQHRMRKNEWQRNRDFSKRINKLVVEKRLEEAQRECMQQTEILMSLFSSNADYREEYLSMWSTKRSNPMAIFEDASAEKAKSTSAKTTKKKSSLHGNLQVAPGKTIADAVVEDTLREAKASLHVKPNKETQSIEVKQQAAGQPSVQQKPAAKATVQSPSTKSKRSAVHDDFELPTVITEKSKDVVGPDEVDRDSVKSPSAEALEKQRLERIEAQKKKKAEQAKKKKEKDAELKEEKAEARAKAREPVVNAPATQPKKQRSQPKKQSGKAKGEQVGRKQGNPVARQMKRKRRSELEKIVETLKEYPIIVALSVTLVCAVILYSIL